MNKPLIISHAENTIPDFEDALRLPVNGLEMDLRMTKDNVVVLHHDRRIQNGDARYHFIDQMKYEELHALLGTSLLRFDEAMAYLAGSMKKSKRRILFDLDLKQPGMEMEVANILRRHSIKDVLVCSPDIWTLKEFEDEFPEATIGLTYQPQDKWDLWNIRAFRYMTMLARYSLRPFLFRLIRRKTAKKDIQVASIHHKLLNKKVIDFLHQNSIYVYAWGVEKEKRLQELVEWGVDGIKTKKPEVLIRILND